MPERAMEETAVAVKRPMRSPGPAPHAHVPAPAPAWDADGARVPGAPSAVLAIQRAAGNQAVMRMLDARRPGHPLTGPTTAIQRLSENELDDDEHIQRAAAALHEPSDEAIRSAAAEGVRTPATTLPHLDRIQASFGRHSIAHVQAHVGPEAARTSSAMNALAYASGSHVVFGVTPDLRTAAHEAAHIVQQQAGVQLSGGIGRAGDPYERHADAVADAVVGGRSVASLMGPFTNSPTISQSHLSLAQEGAVLRRKGEEPTPGTRETSVAKSYTIKDIRAAPAEDPTKETLSLVTLPVVPIEGGHHVTIREVDGELRLGIESLFTPATKILYILLNSALDNPSKARVREIGNEIRSAEGKLADLQRSVDLLGRATRQRTSILSRSKQIRKTSSNRLLRQFQKHTEDAAQLARQRIGELWRIGKNILPLHLMPQGEIFNDKPEFRGDNSKYHYHTGTASDPIPITWYKDPEDYPKLGIRQIGGSILNIPFGGMVRVSDSIKIELHDSNRPKHDWVIRKVTHEGVRTQQQKINQALRAANVLVQKENGFVKLTLSKADGFDGDHVKDLGFGGTDSANNYWPLPSVINQRAYNGYNSGYVINYLDPEGAYRSRAIGGLIGKYFQVKKFLKTSDKPVPQEEAAAAGGTPKS